MRTAGAGVDPPKPHPQGRISTGRRGRTPPPRRPAHPAGHGTIAAIAPPWRCPRRPLGGCRSRGNSPGRRLTAPPVRNQTPHAPHVPTPLRSEDDSRARSCATATRRRAARRPSSHESPAAGPGPSSRRRDENCSPPPRPARTGGPETRSRAASCNHRRPPAWIARMPQPPSPPNAERAVGPAPDHERQRGRSRARCGSRTPRRSRLAAVRGGRNLHPPVCRARRLDADRRRV
jgi:hypothetical protein